MGFTVLARVLARVSARVLDRVLSRLLSRALSQELSRVLGLSRLGPGPPVAFVQGSQDGTPLVVRSMIRGTLNG
jgi:hypothetical protein